jgi:hypothetical protein
MPAPTRSFEAIGTRWTFSFGFHAICSLEEEYDQPIALVLLRYFPSLTADEVLDEQSVMRAQMSARMTDLRALLVAGLSEHHPDITKLTAAKIVDDYGVAKLGDLLKLAATTSMGGSEGTENPPR